MKKILILTILLLAISTSHQAHASVTDQTPRFSDQTTNAGIDLVTTRPLSLSGKLDMTTGAAVGDFNNDGWTDLFALGGGVAPDALYINDGDGTFTEQAESWGVAAVHVGAAVAVGDYDKDGTLDIFVTSLGQVNDFIPGQHRLYRNTGENGFVNVAESAGVATSSVNEADSFGATFGDYDLDGDLDLAVTGWDMSSSGVTLFQNNGNGTFTNVTEQSGVLKTQVAGFAPCFNDMDGDQWPELLIAGDFNTSQYFVNNGDGTFTNETTAAGITADAYGMGAAVADLNNDGLDDWFITSIYDTKTDTDAIGMPKRAGNCLYYNQGNHRFSEQATTAAVDDGAWGWGTAAVDVNHDGWLDLLETNGWKRDDNQFLNQPNRLWMNNGDETYTEMASEAGFDDAFQGRGLINMDYDNDGDQDIVVTSHDDKLRLYRNDQTGTENNWLRIYLDTQNSPTMAPNGFGARVIVTAGGQTYYRTINGCSSYLSQGELSAHFGLNAAPMVDKITVQWPDGTGETVETVLEEVAVNQTLTITPASSTTNNVPAALDVAEEPQDDFRIFLPVVMDYLLPGS